MNIGALSSARSEILTAFAEFVTVRLKSSTSIRPPHPLFVKVASNSLNQFIDDCRGESCKDASASSLCHTPVGTSTPELKRQSSTSSSSSSSPPSKKLKILEPAKLLHLNVEHPQFWQYLIAFTSLFDPAHAAELVCPGCGTYNVTNPYNYYTHVLSQHDVLSREARNGGVAIPPEFPAAGNRCHNDLLTLSECALANVPLPWLAAMPMTSLPAGIQARVRAQTESPASQLGVLAGGAPVCTPVSLLQQLDASDDFGHPTSL